MSGMAQITVSLATWKAIEAQRLSFVEDHDAIIRRALTVRTDRRSQMTRALIRTDIPVERRRGNMSVEVAGRFSQVANLKPAYITILSQLVKRRPSLFQMLLSEGTQRRRWIAIRAEALFPNSPHLARDHAHEIAPSWFIDTNVSKAQIMARLAKACALSDLSFGDTVRIVEG